MYDLYPRLIEAQDVHLGPIDHDTHPAVESRWTHDAEFMHLLELRPVGPLSPAMLQKQYAAIETEMFEQKDLFYFSILAREDDRLIGKAMLEYVDWATNNAYVRLGIGEAQSRRKGYGSQALSLLLSYAFCELKLYRVTAVIPAYNTGALRLFGKFGFVEETRRKEALYRDGEFWDVIGFGLLKTEWQD